MAADATPPRKSLAVGFRFARPCRDYDGTVAFYSDLVGLEVIGSFTDHEGYDGTIFGLPDTRFQFELTRHTSGEPLPRPTEEDLLIVYFRSEAHRSTVLERMSLAGLKPVALANPYWARVRAIGYTDPDGWRVVLAVAED